VTVPPVTGGQGTPTGIVAPETPNGVWLSFVVSGVNPTTGKQASANSIFIFSTQDGTITGWNPGLAGLTPNLAADRSSAGATYTGLAIANNGAQPFLYAADDGANRRARIDVFDSNFKLVNEQLGPNAFVDPKIPQKIRSLRHSDRYRCAGACKRFGSPYTALDKAQSGFVATFTPAGQPISEFALHGTLHSPWGVALAPADFGPMSNALLITDNTPRGRINAF